MLHSVKQLNGFSLVATDGELGRVEDVYFDDEKWTIRHLVVDTGGWLGGRQVLISPISISGLEWVESRINVDLTKEQVANSPGIDTDKPVSRQHEVEFYNHYGYPYYWTGPFIWGATVYPGVFDIPISNEKDNPNLAASESHEMENANAHLRSIKEVNGYSIHALDDEMGHVEDFLFSDEDWSIQLIVIDPRNWWPGKHVLVSPHRINQVNWSEQSVEIGLTREQIEASPEYDPDNLDNTQIQHELYFGRQQSPPNI